MKMKINDICESAKVAVALILAELTINTLKESNEESNFCRNSIDICWEWLGKRNINVDQLCSLIDNDDLSLSNITLETEDETLSNKYGTIMIAVSYLTW